MPNSQNSRINRSCRSYPKFLTGQRIAVLVLVAFIAVVVSVLLALVGALLTRPAPTTALSAAEIAQAVNGPVKFERPSAMEYVVKTNSCVVGGTVTSAEWHVGGKTFSVGGVVGDTVEYTSFSFKSDTGRVFTVSATRALYIDPGENLGLQLACDPATMNTASTFGLINIISGGK